MRAALCDEISYQYTYTHNAMQRIAVTSYIFSGNEFGVFLGYGPSSICYDGIVPPVTNAFSFCIFVNLHQAAPTSNVFRFEPPTGALFSIGNSHIYICVCTSTIQKLPECIKWSHINDKFYIHVCYKIEFIEANVNIFTVSILK